MTIYKKEIIVSFDNNNEITPKNNNDKYCWKCQILKDVEDFKSLYGKKEFNKTCRRCLEKMAKYYYNHIAKKNL